MAAELDARAALLDGEVVVQDATGRSDFSALEDALAGGNLLSIVYFAFDLLHLDGEDLGDLPLIERKTRLAKLIGKPLPDSAVLLSEHVAGGGPAFFKISRRLGLDGIISKRADAVYQSGRGDAWLETKCTLRQEFVVGGWLPRADEPDGVGALLVGYFDQGKFKYAGKVGTGFDRKMRAELGERLRIRARRKSPFEVMPLIYRDAQWARPELAAAIAFTEFADGMLCHSSFKGVRPGKLAREVRLEVPRKEPTREAIEAAGRAGGAARNTEL